MIAQVASISANDKAIGELIAEAMGKVGEEGVTQLRTARALEHHSRQWKASSSTRDT